MTILQIPSQWQSEGSTPECFTALLLEATRNGRMGAVESLVDEPRPSHTKTKKGVSRTVTVSLLQPLANKEQKLRNTPQPSMQHKAAAGIFPDRWFFQRTFASLLVCYLRCLTYNSIGKRLIRRDR